MIHGSANDLFQLATRFANSNVTNFMLRKVLDEVADQLLQSLR